MAKNNLQILTIILIILLAVNILISTLAGKEFSKKLDAKLEASKPTKISIIKILSNCKDCFDITNAINAIKSGNVNVTEEIELKLEDAKELISKYNIDKLPAFIIKADNISKLSNNGFEIVNDALVFKNIKAPYYNIKNSQVEGLVDVQIIREESCKECFDLSFLKTQMERAGVKINSLLTLDANDAKEIIQKYNINRLPTMLVSKELSAYDIAKAWLNVGIVNPDGSFLLTKTSPPYYDLNDNKIKGLVTLSVIYDKNCNECQDKALQETALKSLGITFTDKKEYDIDSIEGRNLIKKYAITKLPSSIMSPDASVYDGIDQIWQQVGTKETDGAYILRNANLLGSYKDLKTGEVIKQSEE